MSESIRCVLEKALLTSTARCRHARSYELGERLGYECLSDSCVEQCREWLAYLRSHARFLFRGNYQPGSPLTNRQEIRLQCGGLLGLAAEADSAAEPLVADVSSLLHDAIRRHGSISEIPLQQVVSAIAAYEPRPPRRKNKR